jgi:hypothetical protein
MRVVFFLRRKIEKESWGVIKLTVGKKRPRELVSLTRVTLLTNCLTIKKTRNYKK